MCSVKFSKSLVQECTGWGDGTDPEVKTLFLKCFYFFSCFKIVDLK